MKAELRRIRNQMRNPRVATIFGVALLILGIGTVFVYSASSTKAVQDYGDSFFFLREHCGRVAVAAIACLLISTLDYRHLHKIGKPIIGISILGLGLMLLLPESIVPTINGARRWIDLPGLPRLQPSELGRLAVLVYLAGFLERRREQINSFFEGVLPPLVACLSVAAVVLLGRDFGTAFVLGTTVWVLLWFSGARHLHLAATGAVFAGLATLAVVSSDYRVARVKQFWEQLLEPGINRQEGGYHAWQSLITLAGVGWIGEGIGQSWQKNLFLPEAHTDFLFAIVGEETGFLGATVLLCLYAWLGWLGLSAARNAGDLFGRYLALGLTVAILFGAFLHVAVVTTIVPTTGLPMPLLSYGGTSLVTTMVALGIVMSVAARGRSTGRESSS